MSYPSLRILRDSTAERQGGQEPARATNGATRMRRLWSGEKTEFVIEHMLGDADCSTLEAHYQANKDLSFDFLWPEDGASYTVVYAAPPQYLKRLGWWLGRVRLMQV